MRIHPDPETKPVCHISQLFEIVQLSFLSFPFALSFDQLLMPWGWGGTAAKSRLVWYNQLAGELPVPSRERERDRGKSHTLWISISYPLAPLDCRRDVAATTTHRLITRWVLSRIVLCPDYGSLHSALVSAIPVDNNVEGEPEIECGPTSITVNFNTRNPFMGHVFVKVRHFRTDWIVDMLLNRAFFWKSYSPYFHYCTLITFLNT